MNFNFDDEGKIVIPIFNKPYVQLLPYQPRQLKPIVYMSDAELQQHVGSIMVFDSECYPNYFLIAFKHLDTGKVVTFVPPFNERKLSWLLHNYMCVGFNSIKYDMPLIWFSYTNQNMEAIKHLSDDLIYGNMFYNKLQKEYNFKIHKTAHIDLIEVCPLRGSLKLYGARLHSKRIQELPYSDKKYLSDQEKEIVADYCINSDLDATALLLINLKEQLDLRGELSKQYRQDLMSKSDAQIAEAVISSELEKLKGKRPSKPKIIPGQFHKYRLPPFISFETLQLKNLLDTVVNSEFEILENGRMIIPKAIEELKIKIGKGVYRLGAGGLHSSEKNMTVKADDEHELIDRDVASYYPAIVLNLELYPKHLGPDFLTVYKNLVDRRLEAKKAKNIAVAECLKITINGTFGKSGSPFSILYAPEMMIEITLTGQLALLMLIEQMELNGIEVVSANTDGFVTRVHKSKIDLAKNLTLIWEQLTGFQTEETRYKAIYARDVNAYMAIKTTDEIKGKNIYYDPWRAKTARDGYWRFQKNPNSQICIEAIENLIVNNIPIDKTIHKSKDLTKFVCVKNVTGGAHKDRHYLGKVIRWYYAIGINGTINYIKNNNKVPDTEGAKPCMDLPDTFPKDIDYNWYINKTKEMLIEMRYLEPVGQIKFF